MINRSANLIKRDPINGLKIRNRIMVHCAVMVALSLACHSEGLGPWGLGVVSSYVNMMFRYAGISGCAGIFLVEG